MADNLQSAASVLRELGARRVLLYGKLAHEIDFDLDALRQTAE